VGVERGVHEARKLHDPRSVVTAHSTDLTGDAECYFLTSMASDIVNADDQALAGLSRRVGQYLQSQGKVLVTAESCTGGWIGKILTDIAGSSAWYLGGAVVYSNALKQSSLKVSTQTLTTAGAVSEATAREMASGALDAFGGDIAIAVTGIAGPEGGSADKPVGTVWFGWAWRAQGREQVRAARQIFAGDRDAVRRQTVFHALDEIARLK
jgi:nicotinamide-nucleotide amidase